MAVTVEFSSGLGNQLFQNAAAVALAKRLGVAVNADISSYPFTRKMGGRVQLRAFALQDLGIATNVIGTAPSWLYGVRGYWRSRRWVIDRRATRYSCKGAYSPVFENLSGEIVLDGYFQDIRYFNRCLTEVIAGVREQLVRSCEGCWEPLSRDCAAMHIRLGDYKEHPEFYPDWFADQIPILAKQILDKKEVDQIAIFSDEPAEAAKRLRAFGSRIIICDGISGLHGAPDLLRMASAPVLAIANSSFSWWAAALSSSETQVLAPARWSIWCEDFKERLYLSHWEVWGQ